MVTHATAREDHPAVQKAPFRARLSRIDVKASPYLYISPFFIVFAVIGLFPIIYTAYISTRKWNSIAGDLGVAAAYGQSGETSWYGNFAWVLANHDFRDALFNTFSIFILSSVPQIIAAIVLASILSANLRARTFWRMGVLLPYVIAPMAAGIIFRQMFADETGVVNIVLQQIGISPISWHGNTLASHIAIACIINFRWTGYNTLVLLAAMQAIPNEVIEAAVVDGAGRARQLLSVVLPMIRPTLMFVIITSTIAGLQVFDEPQLFSISQSFGGSDNQFLTVTQFLWKTGFTSTSDSNMSRAAAVAWILFIIVVVFAILSYVLTSRIASTGGPDKPKRGRKGASR
ncbi:MAG: sugar ABC transporter permease [Propionibacteriaceae bacterium]|jgi:cellobiose transport system permease protein|nr:sugar ABC transporter permease [Propionibacteriaceae bacterium]